MTTRDPCIRRTTCRLCGGSELQPVLPIPATPPGDHYVSAEELAAEQPAYPLDIVLCAQCGLSQLAFTVQPDILYGRYSYVSSVSLGLNEHFQSYAREVLGRINPARKSLVIDIGSNDGSLLRAFQNEGMSVLGIDPAEEIAQKATEAGIETWTGYFSTDLAGKIRGRRGTASIITANNVTANVDDLPGFMAGVRSLLAPDGVFILESSYLLDVIEKSLVETVFHEHLSYYSVRPLESFFQQAGLQLIDVQRVPTKGGSIRCTVQIAGAMRPVSRSVTDLIELEIRAGLYRAETFAEYGVRMEAVKNTLQTVLRDLRAQRKTIAGYGASVGVTTLLYLFDLGQSLDFIADDNPGKQGKFSPGHHIPVLSSSALYERNPDYVLILAWAYAGPIMKKHRAFCLGGGRFIVPLPEVKIIE